MKKVLAAVLVIALIVIMSVGVTLAYFTGTDSEENSFTIGRVSISMDESKVDENGVTVDGAARVTQNSYKLMPGRTYTKDPVIHVSDDSVESWLFVKVENGIAAVESGSIASQLDTNGWTKLDGVDNVYYYNYTVMAGENIQVFSGFTVRPDATEADLKTHAGASVKLTAYAVQAEGFADAAAAWQGAAFK